MVLAFLYYRRLAVPNSMLPARRTVVRPAFDWRLEFASIALSRFSKIRDSGGLVEAATAAFGGSVATLWLTSGGS